MKQVHVLEETAHAKSVGDGLASEIKNKVASNIKGGYAPLPGTRNHVLLLAQLHPRPKGDVVNKTGMWSSKRIIYGYYSDEVLQTGASLDFKTFNSSMSYRFRFGYNEAEDQAKKGRLRVRPGFCSCSNCHAPKFNFGACQFNALLGRTMAVECPAVRPVPGALPAVMEIPRFAATLKVGEFRAVDVARDEVYKEGVPFWLCRLLEPAYQLSAPFVFPGDSSDEGWWVVKIQWLDFDGIDAMKQRRYRLGEVRMISVHSLVRGEEAIKLSEPAATAAAAKTKTNAQRKAIFTLTVDECAKIVEHTEIQEM